MVEHVRLHWIFTAVCLAYACLPYKVMENQVFLHHRKIFSYANSRLQGKYVFPNTSKKLEK